MFVIAVVDVDEVLFCTSNAPHTPTTSMLIMFGSFSDVSVTVGRLATNTSRAGALFFPPIRLASFSARASSSSQETLPAVHVKVTWGPDLTVHALEKDTTLGRV